MCINFVVEFDSYVWKRQVVWPIEGGKVSTDVPEAVRSAVRNGKPARAVGSMTGAIMSARTAVERIQGQKKVGSLSELWEQEKSSLTSSLFDTANEPRLWGHVIAHDDFDIEDLALEHVDDLLIFMDQLLELLYIIPENPKGAGEDRKKIEDKKKENGLRGNTGLPTG